MPRLEALESRDVPTLLSLLTAVEPLTALVTEVQAEVAVQLGPVEANASLNTGGAPLLQANLHGNTDLAPLNVTAEVGGHELVSVVGEAPGVTANAEVPGIVVVDTNGDGGLVIEAPSLENPGELLPSLPVEPGSNLPALPGVHPEGPQAGEQLAEATPQLPEPAATAPAVVAEASPFFLAESAATISAGAPANEAEAVPVLAEPEAALEEETAVLLEDLLTEEAPVAGLQEETEALPGELLTEDLALTPAPFNLAQLEQNLQKFLDDLNGMQQAVRGWLAETGPWPWVALGVALTAAAELTRRRLHQVRGARIEADEFSRRYFVGL